MIFAGIWLAFMVFFIGLAVATTVLWVWALVDCVKYEPSEGNDKLVWVLVIALAGWIGALIYLLVRRPQRLAALGQ